MRICIPGQMVDLATFVWINRAKFRIGIPINGKYDYRDSLFWDEDGHKENCCCHAAYLTSHTSEGKGFRMVDVLAGGYTFLNQGRCNRGGAGAGNSYLASWPIGEHGGLLLLATGGVSTTHRANGWANQGSSISVDAYYSDGSVDAQGYAQFAFKTLLQAYLYGDRSVDAGLVKKTGGSYPVPNGSVLGSYQCSGAATENEIVLESGRIAEQLTHLCAPLAQQWAEASSGRGTKRPVLDTTQAKLPPSLNSTDFLLDEWDRLVTGYPVATSPSKGYALQWLKQHAYLEAVQSAPSLSDNSLSNILEIVELINGLVHGKVEIPSRWQDAWLAYRYQFMTTKMDIQDAISFFKRMSNLSSLDASVKSYGSASYQVADTEVRCRCKCDIKPNPKMGFDKLWGNLSRLGLAPDSYVIWDMTPFSFMVDWFVPIGDILDVFDTSYLTGSYWDITNVTYSLQYTRDLDGYPAKFYTRWTTSSPPELQEFYWFDRPGSSQKVKIFRLLDVASLFIGG